MEIRKAKLDDIEGIFELLNELYAGKIEYNIFSKIYMEKLNDCNNYYIVAIENKKIIGILISEISYKLHKSKKVSFIEDLIVNEQYRNRGIGKLLIEDAIRYAKKLECEVVELTSYITNENAHRFYEKNGFKKHSYKFKKYLN